jgi:dTDP-4-dehydrorhamnose 3,5-epimerase-like enzyme
MNTINDVKTLDFPRHGDSRGELVVAERSSLVPFDIKRVFYVYGVIDGEIRGQHANKATDFVMVCVSGSCKVRVADTSGSKVEFVLDGPCKVIYVPHPLWKDIYDFSPNCVFLALCSEFYSAGDYVRDYGEFLKMGNSQCISCP